MCYNFVSYILKIIFGGKYMQNSKEVKDKELNKVEGGFFKLGFNKGETETRCLNFGKTFTATAINGSVSETICQEYRKKIILQIKEAKD